MIEELYLLATLVHIDGHKEPLGGRIMRPIRAIASLTICIFLMLLRPAAADVIVTFVYENSACCTLTIDETTNQFTDWTGPVVTTAGGFIAFNPSNSGIMYGLAASPIAGVSLPRLTYNGCLTDDCGQFWVFLANPLGLVDDPVLFINNLNNSGDVSTPDGLLHVISISEVPEPSSILLLAVALVSLTLVGRRVRAASARRAS